MNMSLAPLLLGAAVAGISFLGIALATGGSSTIAGRARATSAARGWTLAPTVEVVSIARSQSRLIDSIANRLLPRPALLRARLEATGLNITMGHYAAACATAFVIVVAMLVMSGLGAIASLFLAVAAAVYIPHMVVGRVRGRRSNRFLKALPDAIGLIVRGLKAGLPITETIAAVGREISDPVGEEFRDVTHQIRLGRPIEEAMWAMAKRVDIAELNFLVISLSVQRETGGNLAETLDNLNHILRTRGQMRLKIKAMASEATASALIIGSLPFVMGILMTLFSPDYLGILFSSPTGRTMFAGGVVSLITGSLIMRKMVRFEI
jgi:tight adherence protein B